jgi:hypothetical protein
MQKTTGTVLQSSLLSNTTETGSSKKNPDSPESGFFLSFLQASLTEAG